MLSTIVRMMRTQGTQINTVTAITCPVPLPEVNIVILVLIRCELHKVICWVGVVCTRGAMHSAVTGLLHSLLHVTIKGASHVLIYLDGSTSLQ